jgi:hypothetical protein
MIPALFFSQWGLVALVWLCLMRRWAWPRARVTAHPPSRRQRRGEPPPFVGLTPQPRCDGCDQAPAPHPRAPAAPPPPIVMTRGRRHPVPLSPPCCPHPAWASRGRGDWGQRRAHGPPPGGPWRPRLCGAWRRSLLTTLGTLWHGTGGAGVWSTCRPAWCGAPWRPSITSWPHVGGPPSTPLAWSASP